MEEIYKRHRPKSIGEMIGCDAIKAQFKKYAKGSPCPHSILITGPSGCGKTTAARIAARKILKTSRMDLVELNCSSFRGIDTIRDISSRMSLAPMGGKSRSWVIDEAHQLTSQAQEAFLKILEDTPRHVYFFICTTDPSKLITALRNRCTEMVVSKPKPQALQEYLLEICEKEGMEVSEDSLELIIDAAECSPRKALVILDQLRDVDEKEHSSIITKAIGEKTSIELARALLNGAKWPEVASLIKKIEDEPEKVRRCILGYMANVLLGKSNKRAADIIQAFRDNFFDSGKAGLVIACYEVVHP